MKKNECPTLRKQANSVKKTNAYHLKKQAPPHKEMGDALLDDRNH